MRWIVRVTAVVVVLWVAYAASPLWAIYDLTNALEQEDPVAVARRVNFPAVRRSLTEQIAVTYLQVSGKDARLGQFGRSLAVATATSIADPIVAKLISAEALIEILHRGWPSSALPDKATATAIEGVTSGSLGNIWQLFLHSEQGLRSFVIAVPITAPPPRRFKLQFRLTAWTWKLSAVELPEELRLRLAHELSRQIDAK